MNRRVQTYRFDYSNGVFLPVEPSILESCLCQMGTRAAYSSRFALEQALVLAPPNARNGELINSQTSQPESQSRTARCWNWLKERANQAEILYAIQQTPRGFFSYSIISRTGSWLRMGS